MFFVCGMMGRFGLTMKKVYIFLLFICLAWGVNDNNGWKSSENWNKVRKGMSISQLEEILGQPSSKEAGSMGSIWYYEGNLS